MKISIIVPIYNVEKYLERCIISLINQTYKNIEIILVNDGSKDNSLEICNNYKRIDSRIKVFTKENGGLSDARNYGLERATGDYVLFIDSDDYIELESCEKFIETINTYGKVDIVSSNAIVNTNNNINYMRHTNYANDEIVAGLDYFTHEIECHTMHISSCINMYNFNYLNTNQLKFKKGILHEDEEFVPRAFLKAKSVIHLDYDFYKYMIREDSITTHKDFSKNANHLFNTLHEHEKLYDSIEDKKSMIFLKNELCEKYLYMIKKLHDTNSKYTEQFDFDFMKRNALLSRTKNKLKLFLFNEKLYFLLNDITHRLSDDIRCMLKRSNIIFTIMIFISIFFLSRFFNVYVPNGTIWAEAYTLLSRVIFVFNFIIFLCFFRKKKPDFILFVPILFQSIIFIINIINNGYTRSIISNGYPIVGLILLMGVCFRKNYRHTLISTNWIILILITINLLLMILSSNLFGENRYFLGGRNQIGLICIIGLLISSLYDMEFNFKYSFKYTLLISTIVILLGGSMNNLIAILVIYIFLLINKYKNHFINNVSTYTTLLTYIAFSFSIIILHVEKMFSFIIEKILHRSISFSGRTFLWDAAMEKIKYSPLLGYGRSENTNYFYVDYFSNRIGEDKYMSAHNSFLQSIYEFGFIPVVLIFAFLFIYLKKIEELSNNSMKLIFPLILSMLIILTFEALPFDCLFFFVSFVYLYWKNKDISKIY